MMTNGYKKFVENKKSQISQINFWENLHNFNKRASNRDK